MLRKEREHNDNIFSGFNSALQDLKEMKNQATSLEHQLKANKNDKNMENERRLDNIDEGEDQDEEEIINTATKPAIEEINNKYSDESISNDIKQKEWTKVENELENNLSSHKSDNSDHNEIQNNEKELSDNIIQNEEQLSNPETIIKSQDDLEPIESNKLHQFSEFNIEIERITMEQEDRASQMYEDSIFQRKFKQKDTVVPLKHNILTTNIFFNNPVQENWQVQEPVKDSFTKYMVNLRPIDLSKTKFRVLWSKEKVAQEKEEKRQQKEKAKREKKSKYLKGLASILDSKQCNQSFFKPKEVLYAEFKNTPDKPIEYVEQSNTGHFDLFDNIAGKLYPSICDIAYSRTIKMHAKTQAKLVEHMKCIQVPQYRDFLTTEQKQYKDPSKIKEILEQKTKKSNQAGHQRNNSNLHIIEEDMMDEISGDFDGRIIDNQPLAEALQINCSNKKNFEIEVKNEDSLTHLDLNDLSSYHSLKTIDFSMNSIANLWVSGKPQLANLTHIKISQNKVPKLDKTLFSKCQNLVSFIADINMITSMDGIEGASQLKYINLANNKITGISGLDRMTTLTKLELNSNQIEAVNGLENCKMLQYLNLGRNKITNIQNLQENLMLSDLILYSNQIESIPKNFSLPILKLLKLSMNKITTFRIGYCPYLEVIDVKDNLVSQIEPLASCISLQRLDVSFNQLQNIVPVLTAFSYGTQSWLQHLKFNDNPFIANRYNTLEGYVSRLFPNIKGELSLSKNNTRESCIKF